MVVCVCVCVCVCACALCVCMSACACLSVCAHVGPMRQVVIVIVYSPADHNGPSQGCMC